MSRLVTAMMFLAFALPVYAQTTAIVGGKVHTIGPQGTIENGTVLIVDGRIAAVGADVEVPADAQTIDAGGKIVTPGLFSPFGRLGLVEVSSSAGPTDYAQRGAQFTAGFDIADAYNPRSTLIAINRIEGVTRAVVAPSPGFPDETGSGHVLAGLAAIVNLGDDNVLDQRAAAMVVQLGEGGAMLS
ncbi:MAG: amidohydrolase, partial [Gammaproteobacteria bacterium]|nr:amidohydrolase [Gammaproteobacteria bacterium]